MVDVQPTTVGSVDNIAALKIVAAVDTPATTPVFTTISVKGYHTAGDGGGGMFRFVPTATAPVDDGTIVAWTGRPGRWLRIIEDGRNYDFRWFGARGNGRTATAKMTTPAGDLTVLNSDNPAFASADVNKVIWVPGAGVLGSVLIGTVKSVMSQTQIKLNIPAATPLAGVSTTITVGSDVTSVTSLISITAGSNVLSSTTPIFNPDDITKFIWVPGAGPAGGVLSGIVTAFTSASQITLSVSAATSLTTVSTPITLGPNDDTAACQATINAAMAAGVGVEFSCGDYVVGPLYGNGSVPPVQPVQELPAVHSFKGQGRPPFLSRLIATPGAYGPAQAVLTFRNIAGKVVSNFAIDANNEAETCGDFAWIGGTAPGVIEAPSCNNEFTHLWGSNALRMGWNLDQAADSKVSSIHYNGGSASVGLSFRLSGGGIWADNIFLSTNAKLLLASQNAGFQNCGFFGGVQITDQSTNYVHFDACHLYPYTPKRTMPADPFYATAGQTTVFVKMFNHGLATGNFIEVSGATAFNGIEANDLNTDPRAPISPPKVDYVRELAYPFKVTVIDPDKFSIQVAEPAKLSGWGGGTSVRITGRGYTVYSAIQNQASGSRSLTFTACWFNVTGVYGQKYFAGRWMLGTRFTGCRFAVNAASKLVLNPEDVPPAEPKFAPDDPDIYFDFDNWTTAGTLGSLPLFFFDNCSFATALPASAPGKVRVGFNGYMSSIGESVQASFQDSVADDVSAVGNSQASARTMKAELNNVTTSTAGTADCVVLPQTAAGRKVRIWNNSTNPIRIFPPDGSSINAQPLDAPLSGNLAVGQRRTFWAISATKWLTE